MGSEWFQDDTIREVTKLPFSWQVRPTRMKFQAYPGVTGVIISWKAARELGILPVHYPHPEGMQYSKESQLTIRGKYHFGELSFHRRGANERILHSV